MLYARSGRVRVLVRQLYPVRINTLIILPPLLVLILTVFLKPNMAVSPVSALVLTIVL